MKRGINDLPCIELRHPSGAQLDIYLHGAHAVSWRSADGRQNLFMSSKTDFKPGIPIRGGIPVVFPQFGDGPLPKHGFARVTGWDLLDTRVHESGYAEARLRLHETSRSLEVWPHKFSMEISFCLKPQALEVALEVTNTGEGDINFNIGLHTYFLVDDIAKVMVSGLAGAKFIDFLDSRQEETERREKITIDRETDRVYPDTPDRVLLRGIAGGRGMAIEKYGMRDIVIWNPWIEKSRRMEDFGDLDYLTMVCVETGNLRGRVTLEPDATHKSSTKFTLV
ncbi:MAG: D-hexose-6-phosphate mutarotase [Kiritimatiellia bacterium]